VLNIGGVEIGEGNPCRFVAEISGNHNGSLMRALFLIEEAKKAGADFVKFQCYTPDELVTLRGDGPAPDPWGSQGWTMRSLYEKAQTPHDWFPALAAHATSTGIPWFSSVFGLQSLALLESLDCPAYKIARLDNGSVPLSLLVSFVRKPVVVSAVSADNHTAFQRAALRLWCPPGYPQSFVQDDPAFKHIFGPIHGYDGFSYHGIDIGPCVNAARSGAKIIEAHFQLDDEPSELEANVSLTTSRFRQMVDDVRRVEAMLA
jgi:sialic acid synthase SpsE